MLSGCCSIIRVSLNSKPKLGRQSTYGKSDGFRICCFSFWMEQDSDYARAETDSKITGGGKLFMDTPHVMHVSINISWQLPKSNCKSV